MRYIKKGLIYVPNGSKEWSVSHAQLPVADFIESENIIRIYFSTRDSHGRSLPDFIEVDADDPSKILFTNKEPILPLGELGEFDDCGVMPSWIVNRNNEKWLYYIGWNVRNTIPYHNAVGLAISNDGGKSYEKFSNGPLWDRNHQDPHYSGTSCVLIENGVWKNWYLSCTEWRKVNGKSEPRYHIKYAESCDGINWNRKGIVAIDYQNNEEAGIVKASVLKEGDKYLMWYSYRNFTDYRTNSSNSYRIGYAESKDGINWTRIDQKSDLSLDISNEKNSWDNLMVEYPHVIKVKGKTYLFYNGNGFGQSGFGYAVME